MIGAGGLSKELLDILIYEQNCNTHEIILFDDLNVNLPEKLYDKFNILRSIKELKFQIDNGNNDIILGLGNPKNRRKFYEELNEIGGVFKTVISKNASVGYFENSIAPGCIIMPGARITCNVEIGKGVLINLNSTISHDCKIGDFVEIACGVNIAGRCIIKSNVFIGTNATINPNIIIGENSIIGSGTVVLKDVPDNCTVVGNPAKIIKQNA
jgi:sugar O-acyltransferase (sialic acid O-acetyltransferase NeuD family)